MKLTVLCGVKDGGGKTCARKLGAINVPGFPGPKWYRGGNYEGLRWDERDTYAATRDGSRLTVPSDTTSPKPTC